MSAPKTLWLGTALWGWGVDEPTANAIIDRYVGAGGVRVDTAMNYPINGQEKDFGRANSILGNWLKRNPGAGLEVFCKIGALDNSGGAKVNLRRSSILTTVELLRAKFGDQLWGIGVHWDNRSSQKEIGQTVEAMAALHAEGFAIGLSGVSRPDLYAKCLPQLASEWWMQVKENAATCKARRSYTPHFPTARYIAYGINMGGVKMTDAARPDSSLAMRGLSEPAITSRLRAFLAETRPIAPAPRTLNDLALLIAFLEPDLSAAIVGPRSPRQLEESLSYWSQLGDLRIDEPARSAIAQLLVERNAEER